MLEVFYFVLLFRMAGKCWVITLKRFVGSHSWFYWQATVSLVASSASCCCYVRRVENVPLQVPKQVLIARM